MDLKLRDKIVFITGPPAASAHKLPACWPRKGADVAVGYRANLSGAEQTAQVVRDAGRRAWLIGMDVTDANEVANRPAPDINARCVWNRGKKNPARFRLNVAAACRSPRRRPVGGGDSEFVPVGLCGDSRPASPPKVSMR